MGSDTAMTASETSETPVRAAIRRGAEWFLNNQNESFIYYSYDPAHAGWPEEKHGIRELAALWAITEAARFLGDPRLDQLAQRGFDYFEQYLRRDPRHGFYVVAVHPKRLSIAYNAFAILALLNLEHDNKQNYLEHLADGLLHQQGASGRFAPHFYSERVSGVDYYPGEALLALMTLYEATGDERLLQAVERAFPYYRDYWSKRANTAFAPWQTQAYAKLLRARPRQDVAEWIFAMNDFMLGAMQAEDGKGFDFDRGIATAVYIEGINKACDVAGQWDDKDRRDRYARFIEEASVAVMALQCPAEGEDPAALPLPALGGFYGSTRDRTMRCDRNQHAILGLMGALELGLIA